MTCADFDGVTLDRTATALLCTYPVARPGPPAVLEGPVCAAVADRIQAADVMTTEIVCVLADLPLAALMSLFLSCSLDEVVVVNRHDRPVGLVTRGDIGRRRFGRSEDVMTPVRFAIDESASLTEATLSIAYQGLPQVPVVSRESRLVGILAAGAVCRLRAKGALGPSVRPR